MSDSTSPSSESSPRAGIAGLHRMSATAGAGAGEYRAVNPLAVTAAVAAGASLGAFVHPALLAVPIVGIVLALVAVVQIRRSRGTQTGLPLAWISAAACAGLLVYHGVSLASAASAERQGVQAVRTLAASFGERLAAGDFEAAYAMTSQGFQARVPASKFAADLAQYQAAVDREGEPKFGNFEGVRVGPRVRVLPGAGGRMQAGFELIARFEHGPEVAQAATAGETADGWRFRGFELWFPPQPGETVDAE